MPGRYQKNSRWNGEDLKTESLKVRQYIVYRNIKVKSCEVDQMVNGKQAMSSVQSCHCTGLSFTSDGMCDRYRDILREPAIHVAFCHFCSKEKNAVSVQRYVQPYKQFRINRNCSNVLC